MQDYGMDQNYHKHLQLSACTLWIKKRFRFIRGRNKKRNWKGNEKCLVCGVVETRDHIMFQISNVRWQIIWTCCREALGWDRPPDSLQEVWEEWVPLGYGDYKLNFSFLGVVVVVLWILWNTRNKLVIEGVCPKSPSGELYKILSYLQRWHVLLGGDEQSKLDERMAQVRTWPERFQSRLKESTMAEDFLSKSSLKLSLVASCYALSLFLDPVSLWCSWSFFSIRSGYVMYVVRLLCKLVTPAVLESFVNFVRLYMLSI